MKLSPTQRLPSLSNMALPPARYPPPSNLSGRTHALGAKFKYGMNGTARMVLPCGNRIELAEQGEEPLGQVPGIARDGLGRRQRVGRGVALRRRGRYEKLVAGIGCHPRGAAGQHVGQRGKIGHRGRLAAVQRVLNSGPHPPVCEIDEVRHIAGGDAQAERVTLDRGAVEELRVWSTPTRRSSSR